MSRRKLFLDLSDKHKALSLQIKINFYLICGINFCVIYELMLLINPGGFILDKHKALSLQINFYLICGINSCVI